MVLQNGLDFDYREAECFKIDTENKKVHCRSTQESNLGKEEEFVVDYDYLVVAMGARSNTFNTPGVVENAHFLKVTYLNYQYLFFYQFGCFCTIYKFWTSEYTKYTCAWIKLSIQSHLMQCSLLKLKLDRWV